MMEMVLEKIKGMRGSLWRKMKDYTQRIKQQKIFQKEAKEKLEKERRKIEESKLPSFKHEPLDAFVELPPPKDLTKIDVKYPLIKDFANVNIKWNPELKQLVYILEEPELTDQEKKILNRMSSALIDLIEVGLSSIKGTSEAMTYLEEQIKKVMKDLSLNLTQEQYIRIMYYIHRNFVGLNEIEPLLRDPWLEDIGCDGINIPLYVIHRKYGSMKTNVIFKDLETLREFVVKLSERCGRYVSYAEPILDGTLPDGSRVNATLAGDVATRGPTFSIRKFAERPYSPIDIMKLGTVSPIGMAYFWYIVESGVSLLIAGGVATGKTSFLNSICMFIPPEAKIVSIEDTRELRIPHEHWIPSVTRLGFGIPMPTGEKYGEITLFDLLKGSFRQNPDYTVVGEVRGKEAYVMFQGVSSGHPCMSTFHAGSVDTVIKRLTTPPIELSSSLVESLDAIVIMVHAKEKGKSARRIKETDEIISIESGTFEAKTFRSIEWDPREDIFKFDKNSILLKKIAHNKGIKIDDILKEILRREAVLKWMVNKGIKDYVEVRKVINEYYKSPEKILKQVGAVPSTTEIKPVKKEEIPEKGEVEVKEKEEKPRKLDIAEIFGFKVVSEK